MTFFKFQERSYDPLLEVKIWTVKFAELPQKYFITEKSERGLRLNHGVMPWHYSVMGNMTLLATWKQTLQIFGHYAIT